MIIILIIFIKKYHFQTYEELWLMLLDMLYAPGPGEDGRFYAIRFPFENEY